MSSGDGRSGLKSGGQVFSATHRIYKNRNRLLTLEGEAGAIFYIWQRSGESGVERSGGSAAKQGHSFKDSVCGRNSICPSKCLVTNPIPDD